MNLKRNHLSSDKFDLESPDLGKEKRWADLLLTSESIPV